MVAATVQGADKVLAAVERLKARILPAASAALYQKAVQIMTASDSLVPVDTGRLRASHYVELPRFSGTVVALKMGYGARYALAVHERVFANHEHGQAKFLELAFYEKGARLADWLRLQILQNLKRGVGMPSAALPTAPLDEGSKAHKSEVRKALAAKARSQKGGA